MTRTFARRFALGAALALAWSSLASAQSPPQHGAVENWTAQAYSGQISLTGTAAALSTGTWSPNAPTVLLNGLVCKAPPTNTGTVWVGPSGVSTSNGYPLNPGDAISWGILSAADIYAFDATTTDKLVCTGS